MLTIFVPHSLVASHIMADTETRVRLNVGGVHFEVARSLIARHDSSMLARLVSDTWQTDRQSSLSILTARPFVIVWTFCVMVASVFL